MLVFLDANVLFDENGQNTVLFKTLPRLCTTRGFELCLPHIAVLEAERLYIDRIRKYNSDLDVLLSFARTSEIGAGSLTELVLNERELVIQFHASYQNRGENVRPFINIVPNIPEDRQVAIARTLSRRGPSKYREDTEKLKGTVNARDTLLWLALLRFLSTRGGEAVLITGDNDFYSGNSLHRQLAEEIAQTAPKIRFSIFKTLTEFLTTVDSLSAREREIVEAEEGYQQAVNELSAVRQVELEINDQSRMINYGIRYVGEGLMQERLRAANHPEIGLESEAVDLATHPKMQQARASVQEQLQKLAARYPGHSERYQDANRRYEAAKVRLEKAELEAVENR